LQEALDVFSTGAAAFPKHSQMLLGLALANMRLGRYDEAREAFKEAVACEM
jgi:Flp pilus assembly protein TadD